MFTKLFFDLLSFLGVLIVCALIAVVGLFLALGVGGVIAALVNSFKKNDSEDKDNGSNT